MNASGTLGRNYLVAWGGALHGDVMCRGVSWCSVVDAPGKGGTNVTRSAPWDVNKSSSSVLNNPNSQK